MGDAINIEPFNHLEKSNTVIESMVLNLNVALVYVTQTLDKHYGETRTVTLDISKAFDRVCR